MHPRSGPVARARHHDNAQLRGSRSLLLYVLQETDAAHLWGVLIKDPSLPGIVSKHLDVMDRVRESVLLQRVSCDEAPAPPNLRSLLRSAVAAAHQSGFVDGNRLRPKIEPVDKRENMTRESVI